MTATYTPTTVLPLVTWGFRRAGAEVLTTVRLPHDGMIHEQRDPAGPGGADLGWFPGGSYVYRTTWLPEAGAARPHVALRFEGVQGEAEVLFNGATVGRVRSGYTEFEFPVDEHVNWDAENEIVVEVDHSAQPASRWYPGSGLYRPVHLVLRPSVHFTDDGVRLTTRSLTRDSAEVEVAFRLANPDHAAVDVVVELKDGGRVVATATATATPTAKGDMGTAVLHVSRPRAWSADSPHLYELSARAVIDGDVVDVHRERVGLRTIDVDSRHGLRINGATVLLRGACIHHDNGVLGAATHRAAEFRRVRLLKDAGFNAIRSAHNPMSRHLLDACDELGMYVLDELADYWIVSKTAHDGAPRFTGTWREDADRLIAKDRNRASVVMYAIGNEIPETAKPEGVALTREITEYFHQADPDRPVTLAVNLFLNTLVSLDKSPYREPGHDGGGETSMAGSTEANVMINQIGRMMDLVSRLPRADKASRDAFAAVDVAGYNYGIGRYKRDTRTYPERVILGSETLPGDVARAWKLVEEHPAVIGDFVWAGWEYLGEAGVAVWVPGKRAGLSKPYPYLIAGPGMFDLTGRPDITLRLAQAAWGKLDAPAIGVRPLDRSGVPMVRSAWRKTDAVESWAWRGCEGRKAEIEVYSTDDQVELLLNGRSLGRRRAGRRHGFVARFRTAYEPGTLVAVGYRDGVETSRSELRSATGPLELRLESEEPALTADGADLAFLTLTITDAAGTAEMLADDRVTLTVSGPAELIGFGTANPAPVDGFTSESCTTFRGRALAVLRSTGEPGEVTVTAQSESTGRTEIRLPAREPAGREGNDPGSITPTVVPRPHAATGRP
ncbi:glycoside hydrolase family 2 TIM barrel-domain containing protein [Streptomyces collinus]|uniref:glycoside hydrolase family 2 TIM barrel-domain containing protein n=1 Tax=Streptomyces collinus TaxID=42684 RepID=UPI0036B183AD